MVYQFVGSVSAVDNLNVFLFLQFDVLIYNPIARGNENIVVRLPVSRKDLVVIDTNMADVTCQVIEY